MVPVPGADRREVVLPRGRPGAIARGPAWSRANHQQESGEEYLSCHSFPPACRAWTAVARPLGVETRMLRDGVRFANPNLSPPRSGTLLPMRHAQECAVRQVLDDAAALALSVGPEVLGDWRRRLATKPTITNGRAADVARDGGRDS